MILQFLMRMGRKFRLPRFSFIRRIADSAKRILKSHLVPGAIIIQGFKMYGISWMDYLKGGYELETTNLMKRNIKAGWVVVDVGADYGYFSLLMSRLVGTTGRVFAFEPNKKIYDAILISNIKRNKMQNNIMPVNKAVDDHAGKLNYYTDSRSIYDINKDSQHTKRVVESVDAIKLDDFFAKKDFGINLVKIDIEGAELRALQGMEYILKKNKDIQLILEVAPKVLHKINSSPAPLLDYLRSLDFKLYEIQVDGSTSLATDREILGLANSKGYINIFCQR